MSTILMLVLLVVFMGLFLVVFRPPLPNLWRLLAFVGLLAAGAVLALLFAEKVFDFNPDPYRLRGAHLLTDDKIIDLTDIVPGLPKDLRFIARIDTDQEDPDRMPKEWFVTYRYDEVKADSKVVSGPFGAAIYDVDRCRPPAILSYELAPANYDYLGQDGVDVVVEPLIPYKDPLSGGLDRPEVIVAGHTAYSITDLNIFRKVGADPDCIEVQNWRATHPGQIFPYAEWLRYENVGSFRGNFRVSREGDTVHVFDRAPFERSQIVIRRDYRPLNGSYFHAGTMTLLDPVEYTLTFGTGRPADIPKVYYPEKVVLAFYQLLGKDAASLELAKGYLSPGAQAAYNIETDTFGLYSGADSKARARSNLARVLVWEIRYDPDIEAERLHTPRQVTVRVVGVSPEGNIDWDHSCLVTWNVIAKLNPDALPYGCEWQLDQYASDCSAGQNGDLLPGSQWLAQGSH